MATSAVCVGAVRTSTCRGPHAATSNSTAAMDTRMRFSWFRVIIFTGARSTRTAAMPMKKVATSTTKVACATLLALCCAALASEAQPAATTRQPTRHNRAALARELRDSLAVVLLAGVADRAFPGAYAVVGDSRGILAEYGAGHLDWA